MRCIVIYVPAEKQRNREAGYWVFDLKKRCEQRGSLLLQ
jgi:hypothetical protein